MQTETLPQNSSSIDDRRIPSRVMVLAASVFGAVGVFLGAWGAHGLDNFLLNSFGGEPAWLAKRLAQFETGVRYQLIHAIALLALNGISRGRRPLISWVAMAWSIGVVFFSGSLYLLVLTNTPWLGAITPIGGVFLLGGWVALAFAHFAD